MTSRKFAVLGDPIDHSLSPTIHKAAYELLELDWDYERRLVAAGNLQDFLASEGSQFDGFSVTMPLKFEAAEVATNKDSLVLLTGVANTLIRSAEGFNAHNTDVYGVTKALSLVLDSPIEVVAILGAGATARSAMAAIAMAKPNTLFDIYVRDQSRAEGLIDLAGELNLFSNVHTLDEFSNFQDLTVNTLPKDASSSLPIANQSGYLLNVNYAGSDHDLVSSFAASRVVSGKTMLVWQAIAQLRLFMNLGHDNLSLDEAKVFEAMSASL
jgi:shikimate dehydrogenase